MKTLNIQFNHPVQGRVQLRKKTTEVVKTFKFKSERDFGMNISAQNLEDGYGSVFVEWNYDIQPF